MSCPRCVSPANGGRGICLYCGGNAVGAKPAYRQAAAALADGGAAGLDADLNADFGAGSEWGAPSAPPKPAAPCKGFTFGALALAFLFFLPPLSLIFGILAIIFGAKGKADGERHAAAALVMGIISLVLLVIAVIAYVVLMNRFISSLSDVDYNDVDYIVGCYF